MCHSWSPARILSHCHKWKCTVSVGNGLFLEVYYEPTVHIHTCYVSVHFYHAKYHKIELIFYFVSEIFCPKVAVPKNVLHWITDGDFSIGATRTYICTEGFYFPTGDNFAEIECVLASDITAEWEPYIGDCTESASY